MSVTAYVINMDRAAERWARVSARLERLGVPVVRIAACDAATEPQAVLSRRGLTLAADGRMLRLSTADGRAYTLPEEGCFQSHLKALERFLGSDAACAVIAEDDVIPQPDFAGVLKALAVRRGLEVVKLEAAIWSGRRAVLPVADLGGRGLVASFRASSGSACYFVTRRGASKLLRAAPRHFAAYDDYLCDGSAHGARVLDVAPMPVEQEKLESSVFDPHLAGFRPLSPAARAWFAVRRLRRRLRRAWMALAAGRFAFWRIRRAPWWSA